MVAPFTYAAHPSRVVFGPGRLAELDAELGRLGVRRALLLSTPEQEALADPPRLWWLSRASVLVANSA